MAATVGDPDVQTKVEAASSTSVPVDSPQRSARVLAETLVVLLITVGCAALANLVSAIAVVPGVISLVLPLAYLVLEIRARRRTWGDLGIRGGFLAGIRTNWWLIGLVAVVLQAAGVGLANAFWPDVLAHTMGRLPGIGDMALLSALIIVLTFREELVFRGLFQERLGWFVSQALAIASVSATFALTHVETGLVPVVAVDLFGVFLDSLVYGAIYARSHNVFVAWAAHAAADVVALVLLVLVI